MSAVAGNRENGTDLRSLATALVPVLRDTCEARLGEISWFRADWQRGGAATGTSTWQNDDGSIRNVIVKLPVGERELRWTRRLQPPPPEGKDQLQPTEESDAITCVAPLLLASGDVLGGYDLAWIVMERFAHGPLGLHWHEDHIPRLIEAAVRFYRSANRFPVDAPGRTEKWCELLEVAKESIKTNKLDADKRWSNALKKLKDRLHDIVAEWDARPITQWLHGDLHLANAMSREGAEHGPVSLIDLAEVHAGHWIEDAVYLERQLWAVPDRLKAHKPVKEMASACKEAGMHIEPGWPRLAAIRRALLASTAPAFMRSEGAPQYLDACCTRLETSLNELK